MKYLLIVLIIICLSSCSKSHECVCWEENNTTMQTLKVYSETIDGSRFFAKNKCTEIRCGNQCNCAIE